MESKIYRGNASELIALPEINHYISRFGEIVVKSGKELLELPTRKVNKKYRVICINGTQYYVHKLVWQYVCGGKYEEGIVPVDGNHENFDPTNWQLRKGGMGRPRIKDFWAMRKEYVDGAKVSDIAEKHGTSLSYATLICLGFKELPEWLSTH